MMCIRCEQCSHVVSDAALINNVCHLSSLPRPTVAIMTGIAPQNDAKAACWKHAQIISNDNSLLTQKRHAHEFILWFILKIKKMTTSYCVPQPNPHFLIVI